jgi:hypothetical protein
VAYFTTLQSERESSATLESIGELFDVATRPGVDGTRRVYYGEVNEETVRKFKEETGIDISGTRQAIYEKDLRHTLKVHGEGNEKDISQIPITKSDFEKLPEYMKAAEIESIQWNRKRGVHVIQYKTRANGHVIMIEDYRNQSGELALHTMWKKKSKAD